jgi:hypothetical protein
MSGLFLFPWSALLMWTDELRTLDTSQSLTVLFTEIQGLLHRYDFLAKPTRRALGHFGALLRYAAIFYVTPASLFPD